MYQSIVMKHAIRIVPAFFSLLTLLSCSKQIPLTEKESSYILLPDDFPANVFSKHSVITYKNGNSYLLFYGKSYLKEITILYGSNYYDTNNLKASYRYSIGVFANESRARSFYKSSTMVLPNLFRPHLLVIDNNVYNSNEVLCIEKPDYFYLVIRKHRFVITITLDELEAHERGIRPVLQAKLKHLNDLVRMNKI